MVSGRSPHRNSRFQTGGSDAGSKKGDGGYPGRHGRTSNWGDPFTPTSPCFSRFPIIHAQAGLTINGELGQGILLVEGDLAVQGGFEFFGIVMVRGKLKTNGTGGHFNGAVMAANVDLDDNTVIGDERTSSGYDTS